ncbi:MAG: FHA domain-containing protein [Prevotellaceae bacterium]|nr:FHA domain-containing protein [Prevotellaceae bacterium]
MKKVRCPKCDNYISFDETRYEAGQKLVFQCPDCGKEFAIRLKSKKTSDDTSDSQAEKVGSIIVIENVFHYKQEIRLNIGDNVIGRYHKTSGISTPIETNDPSIDFSHCVINVSRDKNGKLKYILRDGPSNTGTFIDNEILGDRERRVIEDGTVFTIGATSIILKC